MLPCTVPDEHAKAGSGRLQDLAAAAPDAVGVVPTVQQQGPQIHRMRRTLGLAADEHLVWGASDARALDPRNRTAGEEATGLSLGRQARIDGGVQGIDVLLAGTGGRHHQPEVRRIASKSLDIDVDVVLVVVRVRAGGPGVRLCVHGDVEMVIKVVEHAVDRGHGGAAAGGGAVPDQRQ